MKKPALIVTSISKPNKVLNALAQGAMQHGWDFFCIGDAKSPTDFQLNGCQFLSLDQQLNNKEFSLPAQLPLNHYSRKNLGYLLAIKSHSAYIVETDDDNLPMDSFWHSRNAVLNTDIVSSEKWVNVYKLFSDKKIWPRGLPLSRVLEDIKINTQQTTDRCCPVQQGLANGDADVDAIYRLVVNEDIIFESRSPVILDKGCWCPFNSQNTTWYQQAFKLMYLPSFCSFRMTDIWRSFVVQACLWANQQHLSFHQACVFQERNEHNLMKDFEDEIPGYLNNESITDHLQSLSLRSGDENTFQNLTLCYEKLISLGLIEAKEEVLIEAWINDLTQMGL